MDPFSYPSEFMTAFAVIGLFVVFAILQVLGGFLQAIGTDMWEKWKRKK